MEPIADDRQPLRDFPSADYYIKKSANAWLRFLLTQHIFDPPILNYKQHQLNLLPLTDTSHPNRF